MEQHQINKILAEFAEVERLLHKIIGKLEESKEMTAKEFYDLMKARGLPYEVELDEDDT